MSYDNIVWWFLWQMLLTNHSSGLKSLSNIARKNLGRRHPRTPSRSDCLVWLFRLYNKLFLKTLINGLRSSALMVSFNWKKVDLKCSFVFDREKKLWLSRLDDERRHVGVQKACRTSHTIDNLKDLSKNVDTWPRVFIFWPLITSEVGSKA